MASSRVPPGFRFHPTDEELVNYYLRKKVNMEKFELDIIRDVDLNKLEPWDLDERCRMEREVQTDWYFFSHKDRKYPTGSRTNRATAAGFWKATGRDKAVMCSVSGKRIGMRKTLVFYCGRAPHGQKTDWIMHEYRLLSPSTLHRQEEGWVVCRVFKKRIIYHKLNTNSTNQSGTRFKTIENLRLKQENPFDIQEFNNFHKVLDTPSSINTSKCSMYSLKKKDEDLESKALSMHLPQLESPKRARFHDTFGIHDGDDVINFHHGGQSFNIESPNCKKVGIMLHQPFNSESIDITTLEMSKKSSIFCCEDNITNTCLVDNDHWNILETLTKDQDYHQSFDVNLCTNLLSTTNDVDIWKPML